MESSPSPAKHLSKSRKIHLLAPPEVVFPLFTPEGERKWAVGWDYIQLHPESGVLEEGLIFKTQSADNSETFWLISNFDRARHSVTYVTVAPDSHIGRILVRCEPGADGTTRAIVTYELTALTEKGVRYIDEHLGQDNYSRWMAEWEMSINHYLKTGEALSHGHE